MATTPAPRRLVLLFDGTWNRREDATNVWRLRLLLQHTADQLVYYDQGVGTERFEKVRGGAFGMGLSAKVLSGYLWLMENYLTATDSPTGLADDIYIFGFSRGAFTARSLIGVLSLCGLMRRDAPVSVKHAFELSRTEGYSRWTTTMRDFRHTCSDDLRVKFVGVWDTVGALGIHKLKVPYLERYEYHKASDLHEIIDHGRHALAIDEQRAIFAPTLFPPPGGKQSLEQRWFVGSHSNVGGGYESDGLFLRPLQWMIDEAEKCQLAFKRRVSTLPDVFYQSSVRDSLEETLLGAYYLTQRLKPYNRQMTLRDSSQQTIDYTVLQRWLWDPTYNPAALQALRTRKRGVPSSDRTPVAEIPKYILGLRRSESLNPAHANGFIF